MSTLNEQYRQLLSMAQSHLLAEYPPDQKFISDAETVQFYQTVTPPPKPLLKSVAPPPVEKHSPVYRPPPPVPATVTKPIQSPLPIKVGEKIPLQVPKIEVPKVERQETLPIDDLSDIRTLITKLYPQMVLSSPPTSDNNLAKKRTQPVQVYLIKNENTPAEETFLYYLSEAINRMLAPAIVLDGFRIEKEEKWKAVLEDPDIKWILMTESQLHKMASLQANVRRSVNNASCHLGNVPLFFIPELRTLFHQPELKVSLWNTLQMLKNNAS